MTTAFPRYSRRLDALTEALEERDRVRRERLLEEFRARRDAGELDDPERVRERERITAEFDATPRPGEFSEEERERLLSEPGVLDAEIRRVRDALLKSVIDHPDGPRRDVFLFEILAADDAPATPRRWGSARESVATQALGQAPARPAPAAASGGGAPPSGWSTTSVTCAALCAG